VLSHVRDALAHPVMRLFDLADPLCPVWIVCAVLFLAGVYVVSRGGGQLVSLRRFWRFVFPKRVLLHPSALLDYQLYLVNSMLFVGILSFMIISAATWRDGTIAVLSGLFGASTAAGDPSLWLVVATTVAQVLAYDFGYWVAHWCMHNNAVLWEFHKVHHSAEVMTPATEWRQHPVEFVLFPTIYGITGGLTIGVMAYLFGPQSQLLSAQGQNIVFLLHLATFHHLRHSHIWVPFTGLWGRVLHSPAHHHIHHSTDERHHGKNMGFILSIWDWAAGTLHIPRRGESRLSLGIGAEGHTHDSVLAVFVRPVQNAAILVCASCSVRWRAFVGRQA
jgi:sterol desaturase/sphingolipid hydroxylase (fatty acid hydroxylase superfamily)